MSRPRSPVMVFAVFDERGRLQTAKPTEKDANDAAKIIGGTNWQRAGFTVEPVELRRFPASSTKPE